MKFLRNFGPGLLVTAAFIGPGTVTTASKAGAGYGFALLWSVVFAVVATVVLQEMAARLAVVTRLGLGEAVRRTLTSPALRALACGMVLVAIGFGNAAYQTGNLTGAAAGVNILAGAAWPWWPAVLGAVAFALLFTGTYKVIEGVMVGLVVLMSLLFLLTAVVVAPPAGEVAAGAVVPTIPAGSLATVIALIGTTVVPYNLFLHADSAREKWPADVPVPTALGEARRDAVLAIAVGGLITASIVVTAAGTVFGRGDFRDLGQVSDQLTPLLGGRLARWAFAVGLMAAGLTSAVTAPLAAAYATRGVLGWTGGLHSWSFRAVWMAVLACGVVFATALQQSPAETILVAQFANGLLLPLIAVLLLVVVNRRDLMGEHCNGVASNVVGVLVVALVAGLGVWKILQLLGAV